MRVLLVTASYGEGHNQAAYAVAEALKRLGATPRIVDYTELLHPAVRSLTKFTLLQGVQRVPSLYGVFYRSMSRVNPSSSIQRQMHHLGMQELKKFLRSWDPDVVASTFPSPAGVVSELRRRGATDVPNAAIVTDYSFNGQWIAEYIDGYFVSTETTKTEFVQHGVAENKIHVSGIPVRARFSDQEAQALLERRKDLRANHGLSSDRPLFLLMGGGAGLLSDPAGWQRLMKRIDAQFVIVCGNNLRLRKMFAQFADDRIHVLGYVTNIEEWMAMADMIVTKAGGITVTEALAMELPMLIYRPIPGQEIENARFATTTGAAHLVSSLSEAESFLRSVVQDDRRMLQMRKAAQAQSQVRGAASRIASQLVKFAQTTRTGAIASRDQNAPRRRRLANYSQGSR